jgi:hypothetical protein
LRRSQALELCRDPGRIPPADVFVQVRSQRVGPEGLSGSALGSGRTASDDPDNVLVIHHFDSVATAKAFLAKANLKDAMQRGGIQGEPRIELFE